MHSNDNDLLLDDTYTDTQILQYIRDKLFAAGFAYGRFESRVKFLKSARIKKLQQTLSDYEMALAVELHRLLNVK